MGVRLNKTIGISLILSCLSLFVSAQSQQHTVEQGETLYGISKTYNVTVEELVKANPFLNNRGLQKDDILTLPESNLQVEPKDSSQVLHEVLAGETLYGISKRYGVTVEDLIALNPEVESGLQIGQILEIPKGAKPAEEPTEKPLNPVEGYTFRKVLPGETIYGLSKQYGLTESEFLTANPQIEGQVLRVGELVQVPMSEEEMEAIEENVEVAQEQWDVDREEEMERLEDEPDSNVVETLPKNPKLQVYQIQEGDSLEGIAEKFDVSAYWIEKYNPDVIDGLEPGNYIVIPMKTSRKIVLIDKETDSTQAPVVTVPIKMALVLPFGLDRLDSLILSGVPLSERDQMAFEFFAGFKVAVDSLGALGREIEVSVFDSKKDAQYVSEVLADKIRRRGIDLVVGPLYSKNAEALAEALKRDSIPVISPLSKKLNQNGRRNLVNCVPDTDFEIDKIAEYLNEKDGDVQLIFVHIKNEENVSRVNKLKSLLIPQVHPIKEVWLSEELPNNGYFNKFPTANTDNVFITLDESQALLATLISQLHNLPNDTVQLVAGSTLRSMETVDYGYLNGLSFVCAEPFWVDYKSEGTIQFIAKYRAECNSEPTKFSYSGFDAAWFFGNAFSQTPRNFEPYTGVGFEYAFPKQPPYVNRGTHLLYLKDYEFFNVTTPSEQPVEEVE
ncbi:MAG: LysM peptidoglycan-binding domain-containing protein [Schleiferiaceae bacterium]